MSGVVGGRHPAVSVVVPTHERPRLVTEAVRSVLAQDYEGPLEVVVVFDACEPSVPDVAVPPGRTLRTIVNDRVRGLAGARNSGVLAASHELVAFLDDDDTWLPDKLRAQVPLFVRHPDARLVATASTWDDGRRAHDRLAPGSLVTHGQLLRDRIAALHSSSFVLRRSALVDEIGLIDEALPRGYGEDTDLLLSASALAPVPVVNRPLVRVRWQGESYFLGRWDQYAEALSYLLAKHADLAAVPAAAARLRSQIAFGLAASGRRREGRVAALGVLRGHPRAVRAWLALGVSLRLVPPALVVGLARRVGKGI